MNSEKKNAKTTIFADKFNLKIQSNITFKYKKSSPIKTDRV